MPAPVMYFQTALIPPEALRITVQYSFHFKAEHALVKTEVRSGIDEELLALGLDPCPDLHDSSKAALWLSEHVGRLLLETAHQYGYDDPFPSKPSSS